MFRVNRLWKCFIFCWSTAGCLLKNPGLLQDRGSQQHTLKPRQTDVTHTHIRTLLWQKRVTEGVPTISDKCAVRGQLLWCDGCFVLCGSDSKNNPKHSALIYSQCPFPGFPPYCNEGSVVLRSRLRGEQKSIETLATATLTLHCCGHVNFLWHPTLPRNGFGNTNGLECGGSFIETEACDSYDPSL